MSQWINVTDRLPLPNQLVLIETNESHLFYRNELGHDVLQQHHVAHFEVIEPWENNPVPYQWSKPPSRIFGQNVKRWMPIPL